MIARLVRWICTSDGTRETIEYHEGYIAYKRLLDMDADCPYPADAGDDEPHRRWRAGWMVARRDRMASGAPV